MLIGASDLDYARSAGDEKNYRIIELSTGLEALLVSTKLKEERRGETNVKAAAAMSVQVGSFADPDVAEGCAHFLEHMVFMGSTKYPDENYYDSFVQSHGGSCNAFTEGEFTTYQFDIASNSFQHSLDIFANCFISPLLAVNAMNREINAINSEFNIAKTSDGNRLQQLFCHECTTGHVLKKFSWGNEDSLKTVPISKGVDIHQILSSFHRTHYTPQNMKLVVVGPFTLDELQNDVLTSFGAWNVTEETSVVESNAAFSVSEVTMVSSDSGNKRKKKRIDTKSATIATPVDYSVLPTLEKCLCPLRDVKPLTSHMLHTFTRIVPIKHTHKLLLQFQLPPTMKHYRTKPCSYIGHLLGHEGPNSLLSLLKGQFNYATTLSSGISSSNMEENSLFSLFEISVTLTDKGYANWIEVCSMIHQYIKMLRENKPQLWVHEEIKQLAEIYYKYLDEEEVSDLAERLSIEMLPYHQRARSDLLSAAYLHYEWDPEGIQHILDNCMTARSAKVSLSSPVYTAVGASAGDKKSSREEEDEEEGDSDSADSADSEEEDDSGSDDDEGEDDDSDDDEGEDDDEEHEDETAEKSTLSVDQITTLYVGPSKWLSLVLPPSTAPSVESHFGTLYWHDTLPESLLKYWEKANVNPALQLPPRNAYIPDSLDMLSEGQHSRQDASNNSNTMPTRLAVQQDGVTLWHVQNELFQSPKVDMFLKITSPICCTTIQSAVCHDLHCALLRDVLNETLYMAAMADLNAEISTSEVAMIVKISGYSDKSVLLMNTIVQYDMSLEERITENNFTREIEQLIRQYNNANMKSSQCCTDARLRILLPHKCAIEKKLEYLSSGLLDRAVFITYLREYRNKMCVEWFVEGNVSATQAMELVHNLQTLTSTAIHLSSDYCTKYIVNRLPMKEILLVHTIPRNLLENNICVEMYFQLGQYSLLEVTRIDLLEQLISEPYFDDLRTKQQLGYSVSCSTRQTHGVLGFCFTVLSSAFTLTHIQDAMLTFISTMSVLIRNMSVEKYRENVSALISIRSEPDMSLSDTASRHWGEIDDYRHEFSIREKQVQLLKGQCVDHYTTEEVQSLSQENMSEYCQQMFVMSPSMLIVHSLLDNKETKEMGVRISTMVKAYDHCKVRLADNVDMVCNWVEKF